MKISIPIAKKILRLLAGEKLPASSLKNKFIEDLIEEGILYRSGKIKKTIHLVSEEDLNTYLRNHLMIENLNDYISVLEKAEVSRAELVKVAGDSKVKRVRSFKGFLINTYESIEASLNGEKYIIEPRVGVFNFVYDFENFIPSLNATIVGVENSENFRKIEKQKYLFKSINPIFVARYPQSQSKDLMKWLKSVPNDYVHFGDFDLAGIDIYLKEYKRHLHERAEFYIPDNIEKLLIKFGNRKRYDIQLNNINTSNLKEDKLINLINLIHKARKGLDQEYLIEN